MKDETFKKAEALRTEIKKLEAYKELNKCVNGSLELATFMIQLLPDGILEQYNASIEAKIKELEEEFKNL